MENNIDFEEIKTLLKGDYAAQKSIAMELAMAFGKREAGKYVLPAPRERQAAAWLVAAGYEAPIYGAFLALALEGGGLYRHCNALTSSALIFRKEKEAKVASAIEAAEESALLKRAFTVSITETEAAEVPEAAEV